MTCATPSETNPPSPNAATNSSDWPEGYWEGTYGSLDDLSVDYSGLDPSLDDPCDWFAQKTDAEKALPC